MRISGFEIKDIWAPTTEGFVRAKVNVHFSSDVFGGDMPVEPTISIHPFVKHDGTATLEKLEAELLAESQRILKRALQEIDGKAPSAIREAVVSSEQKEASDRKETIDAAVEKALQNPGPL